MVSGAVHWEEATWLKKVQRKLSAVGLVHVGFEVPIALIMNVTIFWDVWMCSSVEVD